MSNHRFTMGFTFWIYTSLAILISIAFGVIFIYLKQQYTYWDKQGIPHTKPKWFVGDLGSLGKKSLADVLKDLYLENKQHKYFGFWMISRPVLMINDLEIVKKVLVQNFHCFQDRGGYVNEVDDPLSVNLTTVGGHAWKNMRAKLSPTFTSGKMRTMFPIISEVTEELIRFLEPIAEKGEIIDAKDIIARFGTDVIASCAFGIHINTIMNPESVFRTMGRKVFEPTRSVVFKNTLGFLFPHLSRLLKLVITPQDVTKFFVEVVKDTMEYREKNSFRRDDLLQTMILLKNQGYIDDVDRNNNDEPFTFEQAAAVSFIFYIAGFETTSSTLQFTMYELAKNPDIQEIARREIKSKLEESNGKMTYENIHSMNYLGMVLQETLRIYAPGAFIMRECTKSFKMPDNDLTLEKGMCICIPAMGFHHDSQYYHEPEKFDPERFSSTAKASRNSYSYLPFGEGPRFCIGKRFALMQMRAAMAALLSRYRLELSDSSPKSITLDPNALISSPAGGIHIKITLL